MGAVGGAAMKGAMKLAAPVLRPVLGAAGQAIKTGVQRAAGRIAPMAGETFDTVAGKFSAGFWERLAQEGPLSEAEYFATKQRPGTSLLMGMYSPRSKFGLTGFFEEANRGRGQELQARTLSTVVESANADWLIARYRSDSVQLPGMAELIERRYTKNDLQVVSDEARNLFKANRQAGTAAILAEELPYMQRARHIYFYLYGPEHPATTRITWAELEAIFDDPKLLKKTTFIYDNMPKQLRD